MAAVQEAKAADRLSGSNPYIEQFMQASKAARARAKQSNVPSKRVKLTTDESKEESIIVSSLRETPSANPTRKESGPVDSPMIPRYRGDAIHDFSSIPPIAQSVTRIPPDDKATSTAIGESQASGNSSTQGTDSSRDSQMTPPQWYQNMKNTNARVNGAAFQDIKLDSLRSLIRLCHQATGKVLQENRKLLADAIHEMAFIQVTAQLLRNKRMLADDGFSLSSLFNSEASMTRVPHHLRSDARELWTRWAARDFETDLLRGIKYVQDQALSLKPGSPLKRASNVFGENNLVNGQWWPYQLCLVRDGAHGATQGGVYSRSSEGAFSIVLSSGDAGNGERYPDNDEGDFLQYCGTDGKNGQISENTQLLLESFRKEHPLRVIRSSQAEHSRYRPEAGFRYDGLYRITGFQVLDSGKQRHIFNLLRISGQDPIRWNGAGKRPTKQELAHFRTLVKNKKFVVNES